MFLNCLLTIPKLILALEAASLHRLEALRSSVVNAPKFFSSAASCNGQTFEYCLIV